MNGHDGLLAVLERENIRKVDGRYSNGFWFTGECDQLVADGVARIMTVKGVEFYALKARRAT